MRYLTNSKSYISVTKPGIVLGNVITLCGGFFLGAKGHFNFYLLLTTILGMALVVASGCVFNNYIDRDIDCLMQRTKNRVLVTGLLSPQTAIVYGLLLGIIGLFLLFFQVNCLAGAVAAFGLFIYVIVYSLYAKRYSHAGTLIGAIAGAAPPVIGYCAATKGLFDIAAVIVFSILFFWQIPHSYAIAIYRLRDYSAASIPILPVRKNIYLTKFSMLLHIAAFTVATSLLTFFGYTGFIFFIFTLCLGAFWLYLAAKGFNTKNDNQWSRHMFTLSIVNITLLSIMMGMQIP